MSSTILTVPRTVPTSASSVWNIDPAHSVAEFKVRHMMISYVKGKFSGLSGVLKLDENDYTHSTVEVSTRAEEIILIGHGTGKSSAVAFLTEYLKTHHPEEFRRVVATEAADLSALTEPQIEEIARRHANLAR